MSVYKRGNVWWVKFQLRGVEIRRSSFSRSKAEAQNFERKLRDEIAGLARGDKPRFSFETAVKKFSEEYFISKALRESTQERYLTSLIALSDHFGGKYLDEVNRSNIILFTQKRGAKARKDLDCLSSLMSYMVDCEVIESNPVIGIKKKITKTPKPRVRYLTQKDYVKLLKHCAAHVKPLVIVAKETGLRMEELLSLEWSQVDLKGREIRLSKTKTDMPRVVPLSLEASAQISAQPRRLRCPYVFTDGTGNRYAWNVRGLPCYRKSWEGALRRAKITNFTWHDLRHTFASWAIKGWHPWQNKKPMPIDRLRTWLGHTSIQMTLRYAHLNVEDLHGEFSAGYKIGDESKGK